MPHRRRVKKGSFGDQLDELVKVFPNEPPSDGAGDENKRNGEDQSHINDRLFETAWRRGKDQPSPFSNQ